MERARRQLPPAGVALLAVLGGLALLVAAAAAYLVVDPQAFGDQPATCLQTRCFCEAVGAGLLRQPANSLSSLTFLVAAVAVFLRERSALGVVLGLALTAVGLGSLAYHATLTYAGQVLDVQGMYLVGLLLLIGAGVRAGRLTAAQALAATSAASLALAGVQVGFPETRRWLFAAVLLAGILADVRVTRPTRGLVAGLAALAGAYAAWLADSVGVLCEPGSWLQGHAVWHALTALSGYLLIEHYRGTGGLAHPARDGGRRGSPGRPNDSG